MNEQRELTYSERKAIKKLVVRECCNYDKDYGCLQLEDCCYMLGKYWTGSYCKHFRNAVLPLNPSLEVALTGQGETQPCAECGTHFSACGRRIYCSDKCASTAKKKKQQKYMQKRRVKS